ncbi:MAG: SDR family oxidoreductase [bacterium]|nr:SDR family oxidoreductase [bacterium]
MPPESSQQPSDVPKISDWNRLLDGRVAVVTGGGDGIGGAISRLFAQHGAKVEIAEIDPERGARAVAEIEAAGGAARTHDVDVREPADVERLKEAVLAEHATIDVLVNNVGDYRPLAPFRESGPETWDAMYQINFLHVVRVTHAFIDAMIEGGGGSIVNFHSVEGMRGYPGEPIYAAMKAAVAHFTTSLAVGQGRNGIRVNGIGTDLCQTPQVDYRTGWEEHEHLWPSWDPVGRLGWPEEQARAALFLASDLSSFVTGHNLPVDGGTLAGGGWFLSPQAGRFTNRPTGL